MVIPDSDDNAATMSLVTASGREVSAEEAMDIRAMLFESLGHFIDVHRFKLLMEPPPTYAVKKREGGGGAMYPYLKHGYVKLKLTQIFGIDWSHELLPFFNGEPYRLTPADDAGLVTGNPSVTVYGRLTINIHVAARRGGGRTVDNKDSLFTIVRTGFGSSEWRKKQELGDVLKGAQSDAFKVAAATLGPALGLTLYWDDEAELSNAEHQVAQQRELERAWKLQQEAQRTKSPATMSEFLQRAKQDYGLSLSDVNTKMGTTLATLGSVITTDPIQAWAKLKQQVEASKTQSTSTPTAPTATDNTQDKAAILSADSATPTNTSEAANGKEVSDSTSVDASAITR